MGRAQGKHTQRQITVDPEGPEGREIGMSPRTVAAPSPIPGGADHIVNHPTVRQRVPVGDSPAEYGAMEAHGVPPSDETFRDRAEAMRGPNSHAPIKVLQAAKPVKRPDPVPVYVVTEGGGQHPLRTTSPKHVTVNAAGGEGVRLCGTNPRRACVLLLNESTSSDARFGHTLSDVETGGGALLPWPMNSYLRLTTQDELFGISADSGTPKISVIEEFDIPAGA